MKRPHGTGSVIKRGRRWYRRIVIPGRGRVDQPIVDPVTGERPETKTHALRIANRMILAPKPEAVYLRDLWQWYQEAHPRRLHPHGQRDRHTCLERFCSRWETVDLITQETLGGYVRERLATDSLRGEKLSPATINREMSFLRRVLAWAEETGKISRNPFRGFHLLREPLSRDRILSREEIDRLLNALGKKRFRSIRLIVLVGLHCGLRWGEIVSLKWHDPTGNEIDFGRKIFNLRVTKHGGRRVPIPADLLDELYSLPRGSEWVFPSPTNNSKPIVSIHKSFKSLLRKAQVTHFRFHDLRHTAASWMLRTTDIYTVKEILGHSSIKTTERYLTAFEERKRSAVDWLG